MKVLATAIVPPHMEVSGGLRAAIALSAALTPHCSIELARLATKDGSRLENDLLIRDVRARLPAEPLIRRLPNKVRTPLYRSDLPECVTAEFDLVHIHNPMPTLEMARVAKRCVALGKPYVVSTHGFVEVASDGRTYGLGPGGRLAWKFLVTRPLRFVVANASRILALSPAEFPLLSDLGVQERRIDVVPNGIDPPKSVTDEQAAATRRRLGIPERDDRPRALFLANHTANKGLPLLLDAILRTERPFVLIAGGSPRPEIDYESWRQRCGPGQEIVFTGFVADDDVSPLFSEADFFAFPTLADTFPLAVLEALAHGKAVLASRVGGIPHQVDEKCGVLVDPGQVDAWRMALIAAFDAPERVRALGSGALSASARFRWESSAEAALTAYRNVLSSS